MLRTRIIPCLQLSESGLVKTVRFRNPVYIGDPINTVRIFNELEVDELALIDIDASRENRPPNFDLLRQIADECFMPLSYGGGIRGLATAERILQIGFEKLILNTASLETPQLLTELAQRFGRQSVIAAIDAKKDFLGRYRVTARSATQVHRLTPVDWARQVERLGAGEILLTSVDREGTWRGFDLELTSSVCSVVSVPVIAHGGAGSVAHVEEVLHTARASAVALGSLVVYQSEGMGVLVNFPDRTAIARAIEGRA